MAQNIDPSIGRTTGSGNSKANDSNQITNQASNAVTKRLQKELMTLMMSREEGISAFPEGENLFKWVATIAGPRGTVYEDEVYKLSVEFPSSYPFAPPLVKFVTRCFHPNVDLHGNICLDLLKEKWSAIYDISTILISIRSLLAEPNIDSPLNTQAAELWANQELYKKYLKNQPHEEEN